MRRLGTWNDKIDVSGGDGSVRVSGAGTLFSGACRLGLGTSFGIFSFKLNPDSAWSGVLAIDVI
jgi:hypothetical protein